MRRRWRSVASALPLAPPRMSVEFVAGTFVGAVTPREQPPSPAYCRSPRGNSCQPGYGGATSHRYLGRAVREPPLCTGAVPLEVIEGIERAIDAHEGECFEVIRRQARCVHVDDLRRDG